MVPEDLIYLRFQKVSFSLSIVQMIFSILNGVRAGRVASIGSQVGEHKVVGWEDGVCGIGLLSVESTH